MNTAMATDKTARKVVGATAGGGGGVGVGFLVVELLEHLLRVDLSNPAEAGVVFLVAVASAWLGGRVTPPGLADVPVNAATGEPLPLPARAKRPDDGGEFGGSVHEPLNEPPYTPSRPMGGGGLHHSGRFA